MMEIPLSSKKEAAEILKRSVAPQDKAINIQGYTAFNIDIKGTWYNSDDIQKQGEVISELLEAFGGIHWRPDKDNFEHRASICPITMTKINEAVIRAKGINK